ncbi:MAG: LamG domain-containing protein [Bacteroidales bacterium]|nr:LamG domain-containing protein [Bacteroidales bacterium]
MKKYTALFFLAGCLSLTACFKELENLDSSSNPTNPISDFNSGLQAYYTFDDGTAYDQSGQDAHASTPSGGSFVNDNGHSCLKLSSVNAEYLNIPYNFFSGYSYWTVSFWVKDLTAGCVFAAVNSSNDNGYDSPCLWADQGGQLIVYLRDAYHHCDISYNYANNSSAWHHYTIVRNGGTTGNNVPVKFYVDGVLTDNLSVPSYATDGTKIIFGGNKNGSYGITPSMKLDNIRFYNRALTNKDVMILYNSEK